MKSIVVENHDVNVEKQALSLCYDEVALSELVRHRLLIQKGEDDLYPTMGLDYISYLNGVLTDFQFREQIEEQMRELGFQVIIIKNITKKKGVCHIHMELDSKEIIQEVEV